MASPSQNLSSFRRWEKKAVANHTVYFYIKEQKFSEKSQQTSALSHFPELCLLATLSCKNAGEMSIHMFQPFGNRC